MPSSRRKFLRRLVCAGGTAGLMPLSLRGLTTHPASFEPARFDEPLAPILLNNNENAYGPSRKAVAAMRAALDDANRYPDSQHHALLEQLANLHGAKREQLLLGC